MRTNNCQSRSVSGLLLGCFFFCLFVCLSVGWLVSWVLLACLTSQQPACVFQGLIFSYNCTCCPTEIEVADPTCYLTRSHNTDTRPTSPSADHVSPGATGSYWSTSFEATGMRRPGKSSMAQAASNQGVPHLQTDGFITRPTTRSIVGTLSNQ